MIVNIPSSKDKIFKQYLNLLNPVLGPLKLSTTEIEVMSKFLLIQYLYPHLNAQQLETIAFHKLTKQKIRLSIKEETGVALSQASFNNILLSLRKKKFIDGKQIKHKPTFTREGNISITFNLNLK